MARPNKTQESVTRFLSEFNRLCREQQILLDANSNGELSLYKKSGANWRQVGVLYYELESMNGSELPEYKQSKAFS